MVHLVTAVIKPHKLEEVKDALKGIGVTGVTITEVKGFGRQGGHTETYRGAEYTIDFLPKLSVEVLCDTAEADKIIDTHRRRRPHRQDRRRQDLGHRRRPRRAGPHRRARHRGASDRPLG